jgi:hypothetical protein
VIRLPTAKHVAVTRADRARTRRRRDSSGRASEQRARNERPRVRPRRGHRVHERRRRSRTAPHARAETPVRVSPHRPRDHPKSCAASDHRYWRPRRARWPRPSAGVEDLVDDVERGFGVQEREAGDRLVVPAGRRRRTRSGRRAGAPTTRRSRPRATRSRGTARPTARVAHQLEVRERADASAAPRAVASTVRSRRGTRRCR